MIAKMTGSDLRQYRVNAGLTVKILAARLGLKPSHVSFCESYMDANINSAKFFKALYDAPMPFENYNKSRDGLRSRKPNSYRSTKTPSTKALPPVEPNEESCEPYACSAVDLRGITDEHAKLSKSKRLDGGITRAQGEEIIALLKRLLAKWS
jgi:hypothetical protein